MPAKRLPYPFVEPDGSDKTLMEIEDLADKYAHKWGLRDGKTFDEVCKAADVDIEYSRRPNEIMLEVPLDAQPVIWLPRNGRKRDDRVIIATALGHWVLHLGNTRKENPGCGVQFLYNPSTPQAREEASTFGLAFIMPPNEFVEYWHQGRSQATSDHFDVPTKITYLRAKSLELGDTG